MGWHWRKRGYKNENAKRKGNKGKLKPKVSGETVDGKIVVKDIFKLFESRGIPLDVIVGYLDSQNMVVDWIDFYERSLDCNWKIKSTVSKIERVLLDIKGKEYSDEVILRLKYYIGEKENGNY